MTQNQISYAKLQEDKRHNVATEGLSSLTLDETRQHNRADEGIRWYTAGESARHNVATEDLNWYSAQNLAGLQGAQSQQYLTQANLNEVRAGLEGLQYDLDYWFKHNQVALNSTDATTRRMAQEQEAKWLEQQIDNLLLRYDLDLAKWGAEKEKIASEVILNYLRAGGEGVDIAESLMNAILKATKTK